MSRFHLAAQALRRARPDDPQTPSRMAFCDAKIAEAVRYSRDHLEDPAEISAWTWSD